MGETPIFGHAAVASPHWLASETGQKVLVQGGNAIEAVVAMAATIAVVYPHMNSVGGDGFWLIADRQGRVRFIDACGAAGAKAKVATYREQGHDRVPEHGPLAALTVPGAVSGWSLALDMAKSFGGRMPLAMLLEDAVRLARQGVPVSGSQDRFEVADREGLMGAPGFAEVFMRDGKPLAAGDTMVQSRLAATLDQLAHAGLDDFYRGDVGREIAADLERIGSPVVRQDLARQEARLREPLDLRLAGVTLYNSPPPTQGLASLIALGLFERLGVTRSETFEHIHGLVECLKRATAIRDRVVTDPAHMVHDAATFLTAAFLDREAGAIGAAAAQPPAIGTRGDTVWMGAIDPDGLAVSYIQSVFQDFGSGVVLSNTGVLMQNRGISFSLDPRSKNPLEPGRKPFHTLNPALALFDDGRVMPYGTMGGDSQPQFQAQTFSRYRLGVGLADAIDAPRFRLGRRPGDDGVMLALEPRFEDALVRALARAGHPVVMADMPYSDDFGHSGALVRHRRDGRIEAMHDPRSDGGAMGL
jgi:gamma-glutamyltranspeptidase/glutathione hydrolase